MKYLFILISFTFFSVQLGAFGLNPKDKKSGLKFTTGTSFTYIWDYDDFSNIVYREYTWNMNAAISFTNRFWLGVQAMPTFTRNDFGGIIDRVNYSIIGVLAQYDYYVQDRWKLYAETSYGYGDYCTCGKSQPYRRAGLSYFGVGGGAQLPLNFLSKNIFVDLGFFNYLILNQVDFKYNHTQYVIGLNYMFGDIP